MIISESKQFIFLHNPKCAGTSVRHALKDFDTRANYYWGHTQLNGHKIDKAHMPLNIFRKFSPEDFSLLNSYFVFGFVRNPYTKSISAFNETHALLYKALKKSTISFSDYKANLNSFIHQLTINNVSGWEFKFRHCVKQTDMYFLENKRYVDLIIKIEEVEKYLDKLLIFIPDVSFKLKENMRNKNERPIEYTIEEILDEKSIETINRIYADDFTIFDYQLINL